MGCCFRARVKDNQQHIPPPANTTTNAAVNIARVSQKPLSDLYVAREIEDFGRNEKIASYEIVAPKYNDETAHGEVDSSKHCICDPPNAERILDMTSDKDDLIGSVQKPKNKPISLQENVKLEGSLSNWLKPVLHRYNSCLSNLYLSGIAAFLLYFNRATKK